MFHFANHYQEDKQARYTSGQIVGDYASANQQWPNDDAEIIILNQAGGSEAKSNPMFRVKLLNFEKHRLTNHFVVLAFEGERRICWFRSIVYLLRFAVVTQ